MVSTPGPTQTAGSGALAKGLQFTPTPVDEDEAPKRFRHAGRYRASWAFLLGSLVLVLTLLLPWWHWSLATSSQYADYQFFPWGIQCWGASGCTPPDGSAPLTPGTTPAMTAGNYLPNLGVLYTVVLALVLTAAIMGALAAVRHLSVAYGRNHGRHTMELVIFLGFVGAVLAIGCPTAIAFAQPGSFDYSFPAGVSPNPATTFYGSAANWHYGTTTVTQMAWGPSFGFFLALFGGALQGMGAVLALTTRHDPSTRNELIRQGLLRPAQPRAPPRPRMPPPAVPRTYADPMPPRPLPPPTAQPRPMPVARPMPVPRPLAPPAAPMARPYS